MNTSAIQEIIKRIITQFTKMFERKAFLHWYQGEGVDEDDFNVSEFNANNLCDEYHVYEEASVEFEYGVDDGIAEDGCVYDGDNDEP